VTWGLSSITRKRTTTFTIRIIVRNGDKGTRDPSRTSDRFCPYPGAMRVASPDSA
jgi:hypothetical protein